MKGPTAFRVKQRVTRSLADLLRQLLYGIAACEESEKQGSLKVDVEV